MKHLHLLIPDLFLPRDVSPQVYGGLSLPALEKLLARSVCTTLPAMQVEEFLCDHFSAESVAPVRAAADGLNVSAGFWLCADPVHLQLQQSQVVLQPDVQCTAGEAAELCATLNVHFADDGLLFHAPHPQRWYMRCAEPSIVTMTPLRVAAWRDVKVCQPQGEDALRWQRVANEIQMLLHGHAVNQSREARGGPAINSLWLWGGGCASALHPDFDAVGGDDALSAACARATGIAGVASLHALLSGKGENGLWVCALPSAAWQRGDLYAWREAVAVIERDIAQSVLQAMQSGCLRTVTLEVLSEPATSRFELSRAGLWKVWRPKRTLAHYAV